MLHDGAISWVSSPIFLHEIQFSSRCSNGKVVNQIVGDLCDKTFTTENWDVDQLLSLTASLDGTMDGDQRASLKLTATLVIDNIEVETRLQQEYNVSCTLIYSCIKMIFMLHAI